MDEESDRIYRYTEMCLQNNGISPAHARLEESLAGTWRQKQHKKRKPQANITDKYRCKNPQQNFSKQNSATHQKAHTP